MDETSRIQQLTDQTEKVKAALANSAHGSKTNRKSLGNGLS